MNRLIEEDRQRVMQAITYSPEVLARINAVTAMNVFGYMLAVDPSYLSTPEGISQQLDKFTFTHGLLYYVNENLQVEKMAVTLANRNKVV